MNPLHSIGEVLASNLSIVGRLFVAIMAVILAVQLLAILVSIFKILVLGPVKIIIHVLRIPVKLLKIVILVLVWSVCSVVQGVVALLILFGLLDSRHGRARPSGGAGDGKLLATSQQEANLASVRDYGMTGRGKHAGQFYIIFPGGPDGGGNNVGIVVGGIDGGPGAWQASTLGRDNLVNLERQLARERALIPGHAGRP